MQLQKTYRGDERFRLDDDFDINLKQATANRKSLPQNMLGALSKREEELLKSADGKKATKKVRPCLAMTRALHISFPNI